MNKIINKESKKIHKFDGLQEGDCFILKTETSLEMLMKICEVIPTPTPNFLTKNAVRLKDGQLFEITADAIVTPVNVDMCYEIKRD